MGGKLIVLSGPSGVGKSTVVKGVMARSRTLQFSVSATTRPMRPGEVDGKNYFFVSRDQFRQMIEQQALLDAILNREDFSWSKDTDPLYGQYRKSYLREGDRATADALGQAAAASGGRPYNPSAKQQKKVEAAKKRLQSDRVGALNRDGTENGQKMAKLLENGKARTAMRGLEKVHNATVGRLADKVGISKFGQKLSSEASSLTRNGNFFERQVGKDQVQRGVLISMNDK